MIFALWFPVELRGVAMVSWFALFAATVAGSFFLCCLRWSLGD